MLNNRCYRKDMFHSAFTPVKKPFCADGSMISLDKQNLSSLRAMILWSNFPTVEDRAIGLKLAGDEG